MKFTETVTSLPYSAKFITLEGAEYFRVLHDSQQRVCRLCLQAGHILRECPDFKCFKCGNSGHYARECRPAAQSCVTCNVTPCQCAEVEQPAEKERREGIMIERLPEGGSMGRGEAVESGSLVLVREMGEEEEEEESEEEITDSGDDFDDTPAVFRRPGRPVERSSSASLPSAQRRDRSRSAQREERGDGGAASVRALGRTREEDRFGHGDEDFVKLRKIALRLSLRRGKKRNTNWCVVCTKSKLKLRLSSFILTYNDSDFLT